MSFIISNFAWLWVINFSISYLIFLYGYTKIDEDGKSIFSYWSVHGGKGWIFAQHALYLTHSAFLPFPLAILYCWWEYDNEKHERLKEKEKEQLEKNFHEW